ncbi:hypothetical protein D3C80_1626940 [compost metagenome]
MSFQMTGSNGLPVATSALPSVQAIMSCGVASTRDVGLDSGITIGRAQCLCISRMISSVNNPVWPDTPIRISGLTLRTTSSRESTSLSVSQFFRFSRFCTSLVWNGNRLGMASVSRPKRSTIKTRERASSSLNPSRWVWAMICSAIPHPAEPAPRKTIF